MKYVTMMGELFRLSNAKYREYLRHRAKGESLDLDKFGKCLGNVINLTDLSSQYAKELLEEEKQHGKADC